MDKIMDAAAHTFAYAIWPVAAGGAVAWWIALSPFMKEARLWPETTGETKTSTT